ncbi:MAG: DUF349 domain-containing protein [Pseudomonadales bacterium]|nr:DUF349 domain-containing protein [Pseudomonadales bacterium]
MFAKLFRSSDAVNAKELERLPSLDAAKQVALLDRCLALSKAPDFQDTVGIGAAARLLLEQFASHTDKLSSVQLDAANRAISLTQEPDTLAALLDHSCLVTLAAKRLSKLLPLASEHSVNAHDRVFQARLETASETDIQQLAGKATRAEDAALLAIRASSETRASLLKLPLLQGEQGLSVLEKLSRGRDKACNRLAREALESIRDNKRTLTSHIDALTNVDDSVHRELKVAPKDLDALIVQRKKLGQLKQRYEQLLTNIQAAENFLADAGEVITPFKASSQPFEGLDLSVPDAQDNPFPKLLEQFSSLSDMLTRTEWLEQSAIVQAGATLEQIRGEWLQASEVFPANETQQRTFDQYQAAIQRQLVGWEHMISLAWDTLGHPSKDGAGKATPQALGDWLSRAQQAERSIQWPKDVPVPPKLAQLRQQIAETTEQKTAVAAEQQALSSELKTLASTIQPLIDTGEFKRALGVLGKCRGLQKRGAQGSEKILNNVSQQLGEMSDWQQFAASPKRETLLQSLRDLVDTPADPEDQREQLKDLRGQWNQLGPLPKEQRDLQQTFDQLAEQAFAVCKAHFAEQNKERKENLQARKALCNQLQQYLDTTDWSAADMKAAENIMRQARRQWRDYHPCDRKALKPVEARFESLQDALYGHVKNAWDTNVKAKEALVEQAQALLEQENSENLAAGAKALQLQWRNVGMTPRGADQRLWKRFRKICDEIFDRLGQERTAQRSAQKQVESALAEEINAFDPNLTGAAEAEAELNAFADRAREQDLEGRFRKVLSEKGQILQARRSVAKQASQRKRLEEFKAWDEQVSDAEASGSEITSPHSIFNHRVAGTADTEDLLALTMEAEMAADIAGPAEEQGARMALQIELMNQGKRNMQLVDNQQLLERWCHSGPKTPADITLRQRFFAALEARLK